MTTPETRLDVLRQRNPFTSSSVGDPWEQQYPHVPAINVLAFDGLCRLIAQKTHEPALNCAGLILGEVGSGKTHLLGRLLAYSKQARPTFAFAYIQPIEAPEQPFRYLLREVMVNLCHPLPAALYATQLERLLAAIYVEIIHRYSSPTGQNKLRTILRLRRNLFAHLQPAMVPVVQQRALDWLSLAYPALSLRFLQVLFQCRVPETRAVAIRWLTGSVLDQADAARLGVPDRTEVSVALLEQEARDMLTSLGMLLARYRYPLVACFDRLENLETPAHLQAVGKMLEFLVDTARGMLPLVCARGMQWEETFRHTLNQHVTSRLETNTFTLQGCTAEQALALVQSRLASVLDAEAAAALLPFDRDELLQTFQTGFHSPRVVIARANALLRRWLDAGPAVLETPRQALQAAFERQYQTIVQDLVRYPPDRSRLRRALGLYLSHCPPESRVHFGPVTHPTGDEKYADLLTTIQSAETPPTPVLFLIDVEYNHLSVGASLTTGSEFCTTHRSAQAVYIREARCPFPTPPRWQATNDKLQRFRALGGRAIFLPPVHAARWYALALLSYAVQEGEVTLVTAAHQLRAVSREELGTFVQEVIHGQQEPAFADIAALLTTDSTPTGCCSGDDTEHT